MNRRISVALVMACAAGLGGCELFGPVSCTTELRTSLVVTVVDSLSGEPVLDPLVWVRDGVFQDTFPAPLGTASGFSGGERPGTYEVHVEHEAYAPWIRTGVRVTEDECHVITREITAPLQANDAAVLTTGDAK